jgi:glutaredoxin-like protein
MAFFNDNIRQQLSDLIGELKEEVNIFAFKSDSDCRTCKDTIQYITEFAGLNPKMNLTVYDRENEPEIFEKFNILRVPAILILKKDEDTTGVRFYGIPSGYEVHSLNTAIKEASGIRKEISKSILSRIKKIISLVHIQIFITPTCPNCPDIVINCHSIAFHNSNVVCDAIEAGSFPELSKKYNVRGVPTIIINELHELTGPQNLEKFLEVIEKL